MKLGEFAKTVTLVAVLSSVVNAGLAFVGWQVSRPPATFSPYDYTMVVGLTILGVLAAAVVYYAMRRVYQRAPITAINRRFILLSVAVLIVSFYPDLAMPWSTDADQVGWTYGIIGNLMLMHVVAAGFVLYYFTKRHPVAAA